MEENQAVVLWGTVAGLEPDDDPPVFQGVNGEPIEWYVEHERCSVFLLVMLLWQGTFGGAMRCSGTAAVSTELVSVLDRELVVRWRSERHASLQPTGESCLFSKQ